MTKVNIVKAMVFPVVTYGCESWTIRKAEHQRIDAFELWCWRRLLRVPWRVKRSNHSILREINPEYSLEGLMLKLKFQYFGHLMWTDNSLQKSLMFRDIEGRRRRGCHRMRGHHWWNGHELGQTSGDVEGQGGLMYCSPWGCKESDMTVRLNNSYIIDFVAEVVQTCYLERFQVYSCLTLVIFIFIFIFIFFFLLGYS